MHEQHTPKTIIDASAKEYPVLYKALAKLAEQDELVLVPVAHSNYIGLTTKLRPFVWYKEFIQFCLMFDIIHNPRDTYKYGVGESSTIDNCGCIYFKQY